MVSKIEPSMQEIGNASNEAFPITGEKFVI
jgi:hypothetical protein